MNWSEVAVARREMERKMRIALSEFSTQTGEIPVGLRVVIQGPDPGEACQDVNYEVELYTTPYALHCSETQDTREILVGGLQPPESRDLGLSFTYDKGDGAEERHVNGIHLQRTSKNAVVLKGFDVDKEQFRTFRADRIGSFTGVYLKENDVP